MIIKFQRPFTDSDRWGAMKRYDIKVNGANSYYAESKEFSLIYTTCLYTNNDDDTISPRLTVKRLFSFAPRFRVRLLNNSALDFKPISFWSGHFQLWSETGEYDIYYWRQGRCGVYKNNKQIAYIDLPAYGVISFLNRQNGNAWVADEDDGEMIMAIYLLMDKWTGSLFAKLLLSGVGRIQPYAHEVDVPGKEVLS